MIGDQNDFKALRSQERLENVAHNVDGRLLVGLDLLPDYRILEHTELGAVELARRFHGASGVDHDHVTSRQHPQLLSGCTDVKQSVAPMNRNDNLLPRLTSC